jgi:predicted dehydrogenase
VVTVDPQRRADFSSIEAAPTANVVVIATPIRALARAACSAMEAGCEVMLVEKPMAATLGEAHEVLACAQATGTSLTVGYTERFNPLVQEIRRDLLPLIGEIRELHFERRGPRPAWESVSPVLDLAVHDFDLMRYFGIDPVLSTGSCSADAVDASFESGAIEATVKAGYTSVKRVRRFSIHGTRGVIRCDLIAQLVEVRMQGVRPLSTADSLEPLVGQWRALLEGRGANGEDGLAALTLALALPTASAPAADRPGPSPPHAPALL